MLTRRRRENKELKTNAVDPFFPLPPAEQRTIPAATENADGVVVGDQLLLFR